MKRIIGLMMVMVLLFVACGSKEDETEDFSDNEGSGSDDSSTSQVVDDAYFLNGTLKEVNEDSVLIDEETAGLVWVRLEDGLSMEVTVNSIVRIQYNGMIAESYPGQASGHSLELVEPFLTEAKYTYDEMNELLADGDVNQVIVWNNVKDTVAYATVDLDALNNSYRIYVVSVYGEAPVEIAYVAGEVPDLNWFYDRIEVQTSNGSMEFGPEFDAMTEPTVIGTVGEGDMADADMPMGPSYNLVNTIYEDAESNVVIEYFQVEGLLGELVQDYANQSLYQIVDIFGVNHENTKIIAQILRQDEFLTIGYHGRNEAMGYDIDRYMTLDMATSTVLTVDNVIEDMEAFKELFEAASDYTFDGLEGVTVYIENDEFIFTFVPTDDSAERQYVRFNIMELAPILDMTFEMPAS